MTKKKRLSKQTRSKKEKSKTKVQQPWWKNTQLLLQVLAVVGITLISFGSSINNGTVNWDDPDYVTGNPTIYKINGENLHTMFTEEIASNYHPLTMLSLAIDYQFTDFDENGELIMTPFHVTNLLLHLINVVLVFWFIYLLNGRRKEGALLVAFLFGVHPMHVESVAWVSERKDVLYALFFFAGLITYLKYLHSKFEMKYLVWTFVFFVLSCFSKPTAVLFSPVLILIDIYMRRSYFNNGPNMKAIFEKIPFFLGSIGFGLATYFIQAKVAVGSIDQHTIVERIQFASYGVVAYISKLFVPINMSAFYPYPDKANLPIIYTIAPVLVLILLGLVVWSLKKTRVIAFGVGFFLMMNILTLQFLTVGRAIMSDRYTYVPYVGLFFILAYYVDFILSKNEKPFLTIKKFLPAVIGVYGLLLCFLTFQQSKVWENSDTLWTNVSEIFPKDETAFNNLGNYYYSTEKNTPKAMEFLNKAIELKPNMFDAYISRGKIYRQTGKLDLAMADYTKALTIKTTDPSVYNNRGNVYFSMKQYDKALVDYKKVISMDPTDSKAHGNIGAVYAQRKQFDEALEYLNKGIKINPNYQDAYLNRGVIYSQTNRPAEAVKNYTTFLKFSPNSSTALYYRAQDYVKIGNNNAALNDLNKAISIAPKSTNLYKVRAELHNIMGNSTQAAADQQKYVQLGGK